MLPHVELHYPSHTHPKKDPHSLSRTYMWKASLQQTNKVSLANWGVGSGGGEGGESWIAFQNNVHSSTLILQLFFCIDHLYSGIKKYTLVGRKI